MQVTHFKYPLIDRQFNNEQGILYDTGNVIWVEGIGSNVGPFIPWWPLQPQHAFFTSCYLDKTLIFGFSDFYMSSMQENSDIQGVRTYMSDPDGAAYNLLGRRLSSIPAKGIYIQKGRMRIVR